MAKEFLFNGILSWGGFISILYFIFGSRAEIKKYLVVSWSLITLTLIICIINGWL